MHRDQEAHRGRLIATVAATVISLACGTNVRFHFHDYDFSQPKKPPKTHPNSFLCHELKMNSGS
jgi:hypothetical protein